MATLTNEQLDKKKLTEKELHEDELDQVTGGRGTRTPNEVVRKQD